MKRMLVLLSIMWWCFVFSGPISAVPNTLDAQPKQVRIVVMGQGDFHPDRAVPGNVRSLPDGLAARVIEHLTATRRFEVVERTALRRMVREQQFGKAREVTDLDRVIEKSVQNLPDVSGWTIAAASTAADHNDRLKAFTDLGSAVGADYMVYAVLEQHRGDITTKAIPFSDQKRQVVEKGVDARLRLRVIETTQGRIIGADSIRTRISESIFTGREATQDEYSMFDHLGQKAAASVLDMVFPPRLVNENPWVINRGANEQVRVGDRYRIEREGQEIRDTSGVVIGKLRSEVGLAEVSQVQDTLSIVTPVNGTFAVHDLALPQRQAMMPEKTSTAVPPLKKTALVTGVDKPRLAVGLVKSRSTASTGIDVNKHIPAFTDTLISRLVQTRRFQLIDRQEVDQLLDEQLAQAMAQNSDMPSAMGRLEGADYVVIGSVSSFLLEEINARLPGSSRVVVSHKGHVEGNMRIVDARSGDIIESQKVSVTQTIRKAGSEERIITELADAYADQVTVNLMNALYPIKVAAVVSGVAYINRGTDGGLSRGETLRVVRPGQPITDPDTGVLIGHDETELGEVVLAEVEAAGAKAPVGSLVLKRGDLLKRLAGNQRRRSGQATREAPPARSGGDADQPDGKALTLAVGEVMANPMAHNKRLLNANTVRITNDLMVKLSQYPEFDVMERAEIDQVLDEKAFTAIAADISQTEGLRELQGADYLVHAAIDDFMVRSESSKIPYTGEIQLRFYGTAEATVRMIDVHTGKLSSAIKLRLDDRLKGVQSHAMATNDMIDRLTTEIATRINDDLTARQRGEPVPVSRRASTAEPSSQSAPKVNTPNF